MFGRFRLQESETLLPYVSHWLSVSLYHLRIFNAQKKKIIVWWWWKFFAPAL